MAPSLLAQIFCCCMRSGHSNSEHDPLIDDDDEPIPDERPPPVVIKSEDAMLIDFIRDAESKMVNIQDDHPFMLLPPPRASSSASPQSSSQPWTPNGDYHDHSPSRGDEEHYYQEPLFEVKLIKAPRSKKGMAAGFDRGRDRTNANGSPLIVDAEGARTPDDPQKTPDLVRPDDNLLSKVPDDVRRSLLDSFHLRESGQLILTWDT